MSDHDVSDRPKGLKLTRGGKVKFSNGVQVSCESGIDIAWAIVKSDETWVTVHVFAGEHKTTMLIKDMRSAAMGVAWIQVRGKESTGTSDISVSMGEQPPGDENGLEIIALIKITYVSDSSSDSSESHSSEDEDGSKQNGSDGSCDSSGDGQDEECEEKKFQVLVKFFGTETNIYRVSSETTVLGLKRLIEERKGTPPEEQRLVYRSTELENHCQFKFYDIGPNANINLLCRVLGGSN
ncbi:hypothetical protein RRG08_031485 [Elysia crispata]|uniref:Ubiquitin-like domain-containing protein n=1 Tax=Elysia crispata TaxID=231223 RepID=A0AAE1DK87_9GAST|nr:hypothetical protein RRG08_031485 [Elysia crispata]